MFARHRRKVRLAAALVLVGLCGMGDLSQPALAAQANPFPQEYRTGHPPRFDRPDTARPWTSTRSAAPSTLAGELSVDVVRALHIHLV
jgi:hypothetical protein